MSREPRKRKRPSKRSVGNRRVKEDAEPRREIDPFERKARNRTLLLLFVLAFVNMYVFVWRDEALSFQVEAGAIVDRSGGVASPPSAACSGDPVRVFEGLSDLLTLDTRLTEGRTLRLGLLELGVTGPEIDAVEAAVRNNIDLGLLAGSGAPLEVALDRYGGVQALEVELAEGHLVQACRDDGGLRVRNIQHPLRTDVEVLALELPRDGDLVASVEDIDEKPELARIIADTLAHDVDFATESRPGDEIQLIVEKRYLGRSFHRYANVLAVRYRGAAGYFARYYYKPPGMRAGFFDGEGQPSSRVLLRSPVGWYPFDPDARASMPPTIEFVDGRVGAVYRRGEGAPVLALGNGVIEQIRNREDTGLTVELRLEDGRTVRYLHLMRTIGELEAGQTVRQGQVLGLVGHSGKTPTDRLRLEMIAEDGETYIDPVVLTAKGDERSKRVGEPIPRKAQSRFEEDVRPWRRAMRQAAR